MLGTILIVVLLLLLLGAWPSWPHSRSWGYYPSGTLGLVLVIVLVLALAGPHLTARHEQEKTVRRHQAKSGADLSHARAMCCATAASTMPSGWKSCGPGASRPRPTAGAKSRP